MKEQLIIRKIPANLRKGATANPGLLDEIDMTQNMTKHEEFMEAALVEARIAFAEQEVPVGAVAVIDNEIVASEHNRTLQFNDPTAHAEILLLKKTSQALGNHRLSGVTFYVTLEPCPMCAGALIQGRVDSLVFGTPDQKGGGVVSKFSILEAGKLNHDIPFLAGILEKPCRDIMRKFFSERR